MAQAEPLVAVLGDIVGSRRDGRARSGRDRIEDALSVANERTAPLQALTPTIGDEFQGLFEDLVSALEATLVVRLVVFGEVDVRFGIGSGKLTAFDVEAAPFRQDGPAWWAAREAVDSVRDAEQRQERPPGLRVRWIDAGGRHPAEVATVNAFLLCRDDLVGSMDRRDAAILLGLLADEPLGAIAQAQGVSVSAISQRAIRNGLYAIRQAHRELREAAAR
jgi:hypothetical protein